MYLSLSLSIYLSIYLYIYIYTYIHMYVCMYVYTLKSRRMGADPGGFELLKGVLRSG